MEFGPDEVGFVFSVKETRVRILSSFSMGRSQRSPRFDRFLHANNGPRDAMLLKTVQLNNSYTHDKPEKRELSILQLIHSGSNYSRLDLAKKTGLSPSLITSIVRGLVERGLVTEATPVSSLVGRKPIPLDIRGDAGYLIGVDIGYAYPFQTALVLAPVILAAAFLAAVGPGIHRRQ